MFVALLNLKAKNAEVVIIRYVAKARSVRDGANWTIRIIQPR